MSLGPSFLVGVPRPLVLPILAFNFAVWKFRKPALAGRLVNDTTWLVNRISDIAIGCLASVKARKLKATSTLDFHDDPSVLNHDTILESLDPSSVICYTDGSAMPNPGPSGAGASIFLRNPDTVIDLGVATGLSSNNVGELVALAICLRHLIAIFATSTFTCACIFSDSQYTIGQALSTKLPLTNKLIVNQLRADLIAARALFKVNLHWLRGHADVGGNERVDLISKSFAKSNVPDPPSFTPSAFPGFSTVSQPWPFGFPLSGLPCSFFTTNIPAFSLVGASASSLLPFPTIAVDHYARSTPKQSTRRSARLALSNA